MSFKPFTTQQIAELDQPKPVCLCGSVTYYALTATLNECPKCLWTWDNREVCQGCGMPATSVVNGFGICEACSKDSDH